MSTMTLSPIQQDYVTKGEFKAFQVDVNSRFDSIDKKFGKVDNEFTKVRKEMKSEFKKQRVQLNEDYNRHTGMILEKFQDNLRITIEYITGKSVKGLF